MKTLYFEDDSYKQWKVSTVLEQVGIHADWVTNLQEGFRKWEEAAAENEPYELILTDMQFPLSPGSPVCVTAGDQVIARLREGKDPVPVIVCSSMPYHVPDAYGCVWYTDGKPWQNDLIRLLQNVKAQKERS